MVEWQFTNHYFDEGQIAFTEGKQPKDCPYDYLKVDQDDLAALQKEIYKQKEWLAGWRNFFEKSHS